MIILLLNHWFVTKILKIPKMFEYKYKYAAIHSIKITG